MYPDRGAVERGEHADLRRAQEGARREDALPAAHVLARLADVDPRALVDADRDGGRARTVPRGLARAVGDLVGLLEADDGVGAGRQGGAGHDADRLAGADGAARGVARRPFRHHAEADRAVAGGAGQVGGPDRVPVHGRVAERRDVGVGDDVLGEDHAERVEQRGVAGGQRRDAREHARQRLVNPQQLVVAVGLAHRRRPARKREVSKAIL